MVHAGHRRDPDNDTEAPGKTGREKAGIGAAVHGEIQIWRKATRRKRMNQASPKRRLGRAKPKPPAEPLPPKTFYYTFVVFPAGEHTIGSIDDEPDRQKHETRHPVKLTRPVAVLDREITFEELIAFSPKYTGLMRQYRSQTGRCRFRCRLVRRGGILSLAGAAVGACRRRTSVMRIRNHWTRRSIHVNRIQRRAGLRGTGRSSWLVGVFDCRRKRSGRWPVAQELGRRTVSGAT